MIGKKMASKWGVRGSLCQNLRENGGENHEKKPDE
jgi:hypothetical protein